MKYFMEMENWCVEIFFVRILNLFGFAESIWVNSGYIGFVLDFVRDGVFEFENLKFDVWRNV